MDECRVFLPVILAMALLSAAVVLADCRDTDLDIEAVKSLIAAKDVAHLDAVFATCNGQDPLNLTDQEAMNRCRSGL